MGPYTGYNHASINMDHKWVPRNQRELAFEKKYVRVRIVLLEEQIIQTRSDRKASRKIGDFTEANFIGQFISELKIRKAVLQSKMDFLGTLQVQNCSDVSDESDEEDKP